MQLYFHPVSDHSHRVRLFLSTLGIEAEIITVDLAKGAHKQPDFLQLNRFGQVPVLVDGNTVLSDSSSILVYLAQKRAAKLIGCRIRRRVPQPFAEGPNSVFIREPVSNISPFRRLRLLSLRNYLIHAVGLLLLFRSEHRQQPRHIRRRSGLLRLNEEYRPRCPVFARPLKEAEWEPGAGTLLEPAEAHGLTPEFGCRSCTCGTCRVCVIAGKAAYEAQTGTECGDTEALICCAVLAASESGEAGPLHLDIPATRNPVRQLSPGGLTILLPRYACYVRPSSRRTLDRSRSSETEMSATISMMDRPAGVTSITARSV